MKNVLPVVYMIAASCYSFAQEYHFNWVQTIGGLEIDKMNDMVRDHAGDIYVTGTFSGEVDFDPGDNSFVLNSKGLADAFLLKLDKEGNFLWAYSIGSIAHDEGIGVSVDEENNVFWVGDFQRSIPLEPFPNQPIMDSKGSIDVFILKLSPNGQGIMWKTLGYEGGDGIRALSIDHDNSMILSGFLHSISEIDPSLDSILFSKKQQILKLDNDMNLIWIKELNSSGILIIKSQEIDSENSINLIGEFDDIADFDPGKEMKEVMARGGKDAFILKLDSAGKLLWANTFGGSKIESADAIDIDPDDNIYVTGSFREDLFFNNEYLNFEVEGEYDSFIAKMTSNGNLEWVESITGGGSVFAYDIVHDKTNQLHIAGSFDGNRDFDPSPLDSVGLEHLGNGDAFILNWDDDGVFQNVKGLGSAGYDNIVSIYHDPIDGIGVGGRFRLQMDSDPSDNEHLVESNGSADVFIVNFNKETNSVKESLEKKQIQLYPNPTKDYIKIPNFIDNEKAEKIVAYSSNGKLLLKEVLIAKEDNFTIRLPNTYGMVFIAIYTDKQVYHSKVLFE